MTHTINSHN